MKLLRQTLAAAALLGALVLPLAAYADPCKVEINALMHGIFKLT